MYVYMYVCMYGWMDGWMDGWTDVCMYVCMQVSTTDQLNGQHAFAVRVQSKPNHSNGQNQHDGERNNVT